MVNFSFDEEHDGHIDDFLHIGRHSWDISCFHFDGDPIYDTDEDFRVKTAELLPLEHTSMYINDSSFGQQEDDMFIYLFQPPRNDSLQHSHDDLQSYPRRCDTYPFEHSGLFYEEGFQPPLCLDPSEHSCEKSYEAVIFPGQQEFHSINFQSSVSSSSHQYIAEDTAGNCIFGAMEKWSCQPVVCCKDFQPHLECQHALSWEQKGISRPEFVPHFSSAFFLGNHQVFFRFLLIPSQALGSGHPLKCLKFRFSLR